MGVKPWRNFRTYRAAVYQLSAGNGIKACWHKWNAWPKNGLVKPFFGLLKKMEKYLIVTDTTSAMDQEIAQKNGIELISLSVIVDGHEYKDQVDISTKQLYDYLRDGKIPSTSQPNTGYLVEQMEKWQEEDYEAIIIITCSADLSGTNNGFHLAKDTVGLDNVYIYDSRQVGAPVMDMAICAKQLADEGKTVDEIFG